MGNRYYITGVQLGIIMALAINMDSKSLKELLKEIEDKQYLCEAEELKGYEKTKVGLNKLRKLLSQNIEKEKK